MRCLSASELVEVWEYGLDRDPVQRGLTLLAACSNQNPRELASLSIGRRDARLLDVYELLFGPAIDAFAECPACGQRLEYSLTASDLKGAPVDADAHDLMLQSDGWRLHLRLPNSLDLEAAGRVGDVPAAQRLLLERCIVEASRDGAMVSLKTVPDSLAGEIEKTLAQADPLTELLLSLGCANCRHAWQVLFDVERFLWVKISALAKRLLREVHALARAYGWTQAEVLSLSARRRQAYLELAGA